MYPKEACVIKSPQRTKKSCGGICSNSNVASSRKRASEVIHPSHRKPLLIRNDSEIAEVLTNKTSLAQNQCLSTVNGQLNVETVSITPGENNVQNSLLISTSPEKTSGRSQPSKAQSRADTRFTVENSLIKAEKAF